MIYTYKALVSFHLSARPALHMPSESSRSTMTWHSKREKWVRKSERDRGRGGETEWQRVRGERGKTLDACFTHAHLYVGLNTTIFPTISFCLWLHAAKKKRKKKEKIRSHSVTMHRRRWNASTEKTLWHKVNEKNVKDKILIVPKFGCLLLQNLKEKFDNQHYYIYFNFLMHTKNGCVVGSCWTLTSANMLFKFPTVCVWGKWLPCELGLQSFGH